MWYVCCLASVLNMNVTSSLVTLSPGAPTDRSLPMFWGFVAIAVASILFGSNLIPVKKFETGDGV